MDQQLYQLFEFQRAGLQWIFAAAGSAPLPLPWTNLDQVVVPFSEDVQVSTNSLTIAGVNTANYAVSSVAYDPNTFTATWTLASALSGRLIPNHR